MMIGSQLVLLALGVASVVASDPDCSVCTYHDSIGFLEGDHCQGFYMCVKKANFNELSQQEDVTHADLYDVFEKCCAEGLAWDQPHLTCIEDDTCIVEPYYCPIINSTTTIVPCLMREDQDDDSKFITYNNVTMDCPHGQVWNQTYCTCVHGLPGDVAIEPPCTKILDFHFTGTYDSYSCYNFAKGIPYGEPELFADVLYLNGSQFLTIGYLNNWFAWNPVASTFTVCMWINPHSEGQTAAILNTNCDMVDPQNGEIGSVVDLVLEGGVLILYLGQNRIDSQMIVPDDEWTKICVVFDNGIFKVYWNGHDHFGEGIVISTFPYTFAPNTHSATTIGFKPDFDNFHGRVDDFCFYTEAKDAAAIELDFTLRFD